MGEIAPLGFSFDEERGGVKCCEWWEGGGCQFPTPRGRVGGKTKFPA